MEPLLASVSAAAAALDSARGATSGLGSGRAATRQRRRTAYVRFREATAQAIVTAEYLTAIRAASRTSQRQTGGTVLFTGLIDLISPLDSVPRALQPIVRMAFGYSLASDLVSQHEVRTDVRKAFDTLGELIRASAELSHTASAEVREQGEELLQAVEALFAAMPSPHLPLRSLLRPSASESRRAYELALATAWQSHEGFRASIDGSPGYASRVIQRLHPRR